MTKKSIQNFREDLQSFLNDLKHKYDCTEITIGSIAYSDSDFHFKVNAKCGGAKAIESRYKNITAWLELHGIDKSFLNKEIGIGSEKFKLIDFDTKKRSYPVIIEKNGKRFKTSVGEFKFKAGIKN